MDENIEPLTTSFGQSHADKRQIEELTDHFSKHQFPGLFYFHFDHISDGFGLGTRFSAVSGPL